MMGPNKLEYFSLAIFIQSIQIFVDNAKSLLITWSTVSASPSNIRLAWIFFRGKHSSLFFHTVSVLERKLFKRWDQVEHEGCDPGTPYRLRAAFPSTWIVKI
jgi:hypothetical protein